MPSGYAVAIVIGVYPFLISWFFNRCVMLRERKDAEDLDQALEVIQRTRPPLLVKELASRKDAPSKRIVAAIEEMARVRANSPTPPSDLAARVAAEATSREPRRALLEMCAWLAAVLLVTAAFGAWPLVSGGKSVLRAVHYLWVSREQARESGQILLVGGILSLVSGLAALLWVPIAWRPVRDRFRRVLEEAAAKL